MEHLHETFDFNNQTRQGLKDILDFESVREIRKQKMDEDGGKELAGKERKGRGRWGKGGRGGKGSEREGGDGKEGERKDGGGKGRWDGNAGKKVNQIRIRIRSRNPGGNRLWAGSGSAYNEYKSDIPERTQGKSE